MTLRNKLILWYSGLLALVLIAFGVSLYSVTRWVLVTTVDSALVETANEVLKNSKAELVREFGAPVRIAIFLPELDIFRASGVVVQVWEVGEVTRLAKASDNLGDYRDPLDPAPLNNAALLFASLPDNNQNHFSNISVNGEAWRVLTRPIDVWGHQVILQTATTMATINQASSGLLAIAVGSMVIALLGTSLLGIGMTNRALQPIDRITQAAARIAAADDLKTRLPWDGPMDELGRLTSVFNQMMGRLEHLFSVQQRFIADVSHELRTPLTAIRGHVDLIKRYGMDRDSLDAIEGEVERMSRLVSDLLLLAKADYGGLTLDHHPLDLDLIVHEVYRETRVLAKDRDLRITIHDFQAVRVNGDADRLKQLLLNLVSNAIKFTPDGGEIVLNLRKTAYDAEIEVSDTGIGIAHEDLVRIFDRFYQAEPSRVRKGEGSGLGLSIAKWIAEAHGGSIRAESELGVGTTFIVTIPHIEEPAKAMAEAVTRSRLGIIRRGITPRVKS